MSVRRLAPDALQPTSFAFTKANDNWADGQIAKYPSGRQASAVIPLLWRAQEQHDGWLPRVAIEAVANKLGMAPMRVMEVATFYTMFNLAPVGVHFVQVCGTVPCHLCGALDLIKVCQEKIGPQNTVTADGKLSWLEVECLGACSNAPMAQINFDYYEDLTAKSFGKLLDDLRAGKTVKTGSQTGRSCSEPAGGGTTLKSKALYDGSEIGRGDWQKRIKDSRAAAAKAAADAAKATAAGVAASAPVTVPAPAPVIAKPAAPKVAVAKSLKVVPAAKITPVAKPKAAPAAKVVAPKVAAPVVADPKPELLKAPRPNADGKKGKGDDLQLIKGVGPKLSAMLNGMGIWHFDQIAVWTRTNLDWVDAKLEGFKGRAKRDEWVRQAKTLANRMAKEKAKADQAAAKAAMKPKK
jgi:NADH-quinone oxidoreductase subunit E